MTTVAVTVAVFIATLTGQQTLAELSLQARPILGAPPEPRATLTPACRGWGDRRDPFAQGHVRGVWRS